MKGVLLSLFVLLVTHNVCVKHLIVPDYPRLARIASLQGSVSVELEISPEGKVLSASGSGADKLLRDASEANVRLWTFWPIAGPSTKHTITYVYKLEGKELYEDPTPRVSFELPDKIEITSRPYRVQTATPTKSK